jgi:DNA-binding GntR family transcriptional regulator
MAYKRPSTDAERAQAARVRQEKLVALQERLAEQVQAITTGQQWAAWLRTAGRFHSYRTGATQC